jgi:hypothetical protein
MTGGIFLVAGRYLVTAAGLTGVRASARALLAVAGMAERLTSSIQTCWPFITAIVLRRTGAPVPAWPRLPAVAELATIGTGYLGASARLRRGGGDQPS